MARWLDSESGQAAFIDRLTAAVRPGSVILLPPVLGTKPDYHLFHKLEQATGCKLVETVGLPPAVTGYRLRRLLVNCLGKLNVKLIKSETNVVRGIIENGRCTGIVTGNLDRERTYCAESFILASGGFFGGGLQAEAGRASEVVFDLPVAVPADPVDKEKLFFAGSQPFAKFGLQVDGKLRLVDASGKLLLENVYITPFDNLSNIVIIIVINEKQQKTESILIVSFVLIAQFLIELFSGTMIVQSCHHF